VLCPELGRGRPLASVHVPTAAFCDPEEVARVAVAHGVLITARLEPLERVLANCLEHDDPIAVAPDEVLVAERRDELCGRAADLARRLGGAASGEDAEAH
jgi:hypothetical protein